MKKIFITFFLFTVMIGFTVEPLNKSTFFTDDELKKIDQGELISRMYIKYNKRKENSHDKIDIPRTKYNDEDFSPYEIIADEKGYFPYELTEESKLKLYNIFTSFSQLTGMKYYSRRAGKPEQLIKKCYRVKSLSGKKFNDIVYDKIDPKVSNMFYQEDNKFGDLVYRSDLYNEGNNFVLINTNLEPISKLVFTVNDKEEFQIYSFYIYDEEKKGFYYYSFLAMRVNVDLVLKGGLFGPTAFSNRLRASSVHLAYLIGLNWEDKLNAWKGIYDNYK